MPSFELHELAIHVVLKQSGGVRLDPKLSQGLSPLEGPSAQFLERKFIDAMEEANDIVRMSDPVSPVPGLIRDYYTGARSLLATSQAVATRLQEVQTGVTSDGLLLVARAEREGVQTLLIAKMEHERGARAEPIMNAAGESVYQIEVLDDLFLTSKTKVFKVASFDARCSDWDSFRGKLTDSQIGGRNLADYFLHDFLGCERARRAEALTQAFFKAATKAIRALTIQDRARAHVAIVSELQSHSGQVRVRDFANAHLPLSVRDQFVAAVSNENVPLVFTKDTTLIANDLNSVQIKFENGSILYSLPESIGDSVIVQDDQTAVYSRPASVATGTKRLSQINRFPDVVPQ